MGCPVVLLLLWVVLRHTAATSGETYAAALNLSNVSWPEVDVDCALEVDWARRRVVAGGLVVFGAKEGAPPMPPLRPRLCSTSGGDSEVAVLTIATDVAYLREWESFTWNKMCYCARHGHRFMLFLGTVSPEAPSPLCPTHRASQHWIKSVAIHAALLLLETTTAAGVLVMDADAIFSRGTFAHPRLVECYRDAASPAALAFAGVEHYQVFVNAAVLFVRRSEWTEALLAAWWYHRCGEKDQLILWHALFSLWKVDGAPIDYDGVALLDYVSRDKRATNMTYRVARRSVVFDMAKRAFPANFHPGTAPSGRATLKETGILRFPHFALLPLTPLRGTHCGTLPPFRGVLHDHKNVENKMGRHDAKKNVENNKARTSFIAHTKHKPSFDCCLFPSSSSSSSSRRRGGEVGDNATAVAAKKGADDDDDDEEKNFDHREEEGSDHSSSSSRRRRFTCAASSSESSL